MRGPVGTDLRLPRAHAGCPSRAQIAAAELSPEVVTLDDLVWDGWRVEYFHSVVAQGTRGRLPTQLSTAGLAYDAEAAADTQAAVEDLQYQIDRLQDGLDRVGALVLDDPEPHS